MKNSKLFNGPLGEDHRTFTDDDLKRLKQLINEDYAIYKLDEPTTRALIARLDASESANEAWINDEGDYAIGKRISAWHAAAGKS